MTIFKKKMVKNNLALNTLNVVDFITQKVRTQMLYCKYRDFKVKFILIFKKIVKKIQISFFYECFGLF